MNTFVLRSLLVIAGLVPAAAFAHGGGVSGYSGLGGSTCTSCHGGGATPTVALAGPSTLTAGQTGTYTLTITGGPAVVGGLDVASSANGTLIAGAGNQLLRGEVTHTSPGTFSGGKLTYSFSAKAGASGSFTLYAAGLSANGSGTSGDGTGTATLMVTIGAAANTPPTVSLTSPTGGSSFTAPATVALAATASDADGTVAKVEFFQGATKLGEDLTAPYTFSWANVAAGSYSLTARATDSSGAVTTSSPVSVTVAAAPVPNVPPSVSLTSPTGGSSFTAPATLALAATASDSDGTVAKVEFFQGATKLGEDLTAPYTFSWANVAAGTYSITARATDNSGATTTSAAVSVTVAAAPVPNVPPSVALTSPAPGSSYTTPTSIVLAANASDSDGTVARVEFFAGTLKLGEDLTAPYTFNWATATAGTYDLTARATDNSGAASTSQAVRITVTNPAPLNVPPTVSLTSPVNNMTFTAPATVSLAATAADSDGTLAKVEFFAGTMKIGEALAAPYAMTWSNVGAGSYSLTATATDNLGAATTSTPVTVTVTGVQTPSTMPPTVMIAKPTAGTFFSNRISITVRASDADGRVVKVEYFDGATRLGETLDGRYVYAWTTIAFGLHTVRAVATDDSGLTASASVDITVLPSDCRHPKDGSTNQAQCDVIATTRPLEAGGLGGVEGGCSVSGGSSMLVLAAAALLLARRRRPAAR